ncbi:MAG: 50S ribosomal protein L4 [bacterium]|nr:50S ribosomal protein L4 [bacterium]
MKIKVFNQNKEAIKEIELPKEIFEIETNSDLIHQVILVQRANRRQKTAKTKDRSEVRGGGKKPWRQKGTGRARHGSIRSPLWRGGGVTFGPNLEKVFKKRIPKKMRIKALFMVLSAKAKENLFLVLDKLEFEKPKTKKMAEILNKLFLKDGSGLVVLSKMDKNLILSVRNISGVNSIQAKDLNVLDLLSYKYVLISEAGIKKIRETFLK